MKGLFGGRAGFVCIFSRFRFRALIFGDFFFGFCCSDSGVVVRSFSCGFERGWGGLGILVDRFRLRWGRGVGFCL